MRRLPQAIAALLLCAFSLDATAEDGLDMEVDSFGLTLELALGDDRRDLPRHWLDRVRPGFLFGVRLGRIDPEEGTLLRCEERCDRWPEEARAVKLDPAAIARALRRIGNDERWNWPLVLPGTDLSSVPPLEDR